MRVLVDTNILLDHLEGRAPFFTEAAVIWALAEHKRFEPFVSAISFTTLFYLGRKSMGYATAMAGIQKVHQVFSVAEVNVDVIGQAISSGFADFEDAVQAFSGRRTGCTHVITRDTTGFRTGPLVVLTPAEFITSITAAP
jgi:predicted nucleic acid-binding protein